MADMVTNTISDKTELHFSSGEHKVLGMEGPFMESMRDNAPRVVGGLRLTSILMASVAHPLLGMHALFVLGSESILLLFGNRQNVEKYREEESQKSPPHPLSKAVQPHKYPLESSAALDVIGEIPHFLLGAGIIMGLDLPWLEDFMGEQISDAASAGEATGDCPPGHEWHCEDGVDVMHAEQPSTPERPNFAERPKTLSFEESIAAARAQENAATLAAEQTTSQVVTEAATQAAETPAHVHLTGAALMLHGALGVMAHLPLWLFGPEKAGHHAEHLDLSGDDVAPEHVQEALEFSHSESKVVGTDDKGLMEWFKDNQVMVSSTLQVAIGITMMVAVGLPDIYQWAGVPLAAAGVIQGALVTKRDFSAEVAPEETTENQVRDTTHYGKVIQDYAKQLGLPSPATH